MQELFAIQHEDPWLTIDFLHGGQATRSHHSDTLCLRSVRAAAHQIAGDIQQVADDGIQTSAEYSTCVMLR